VRTSGSSSAQPQGVATLRDYLQVVKRRKWVIVQAVVLVPLAAVLFSLQQTPKYQATADVLLSRQNLANSLNGIQDPTASTQADRLAQTQADLARSSAVAELTLDALDLRDRTPAEFLGQSTVAAKTNADILEFTVTDVDKGLVVRLAKTYAQQYRAYRHELDTKALEDARAALEQRIKAMGDERGALYASLVEREQQLRTMEALQTSNAFVINAPDRAVQVSPRPKRNGALGLILGLFLGVGLAFLREALDTRVRSAQEIGERLGLPLLARIPEPPKNLRAENKLVMLAEPTGVPAEAFRMLRTNLDFATLGRDVKSIVMTSAVEQEGKSTTVANLAVALARAGQKVILVDLDLRRPFVDKFFDLRGRPGITQVAIGRATLNEALVRVPITAIEPAARARSRYDRNANGAPQGRLAVLGSGPIPPDPGEFVASQALTEVLEELRDIADVLLVDAPPLLHVGDAMVLSAKVDAMILAAKIETIRRPMLNEVHRLLENVPALKLGFVATGAEAEEGYGASYGYGSGYGYAPVEQRESERVR
jgi:Mrp family chromosome partitioning ATPase/capsular polysaccharide biosynthesis protein